MPHIELLDAPDYPGVGLVSVDYCEVARFEKSDPPAWVAELRMALARRDEIAVEAKAEWEQRHPTVPLTGDAAFAEVANTTP